MRVDGIPLFAAFGLFTGYLLPSENVTQVIALALTLCSFAAGLFIPLSHFSPDLQTFAKFTPLYGLSQLVHYPLAGGTPGMGLDPEPGRMARDLRDRRRLAPAARHRQSVIHRRSHL